MSRKIKLEDMPQAERYTKLRTESRLMIKMICYRAETSMANLLYETFKRAADERRMLIEQLIMTPADVIPDYKTITLTAQLHGLSAPRFNKAVEHLVNILNESKAVFPGTDLAMILILDCERSGVLNVVKNLQYM